jgi:Ni,Fe-hydrogenase III large subunit
MQLAGLQLPLRAMPAPLPMWQAQVDATQWLALAQHVAQAAGRLVSVWGSASAEGNTAHAAFATAEGLVWASLPLAAGGASYPDLAPLFACATRLQRAVADLSGLQAAGAADQRPWLDHGLWADPAGTRTPPLAHGACATGAPPGTLPAEYPFVRVEGDGVHEIAVGPVHAGIIEPGHFRFSVVGEKVLRLEQHLGYKHKGIEHRFTQLPPLQAHRLAGRVSGDSTVAFAWAYCMALESACGTTVPERALWLRALMLERERVANHLGDLGALGNDAAFAFGLAQFSRLREDWQRLSMLALGHRFMMDVVVPGGVAADLNATLRDDMRLQCDSVERELRRLRHIYDEHAGLQDRFMTTGRVTPELAARLGLAGMAGRASGLANDLRCNHAWLPYAQLRTTMATQQGGDVAARVAVRFDELIESLRLIRALCAGLPQGATATDVVLLDQPAQAIGWVEGWRGEVLVALQLRADGRISRCHCHDPSWQNWPVLEHAVIGNIVPDFPLINKSFNLSYSGHDL